MAFYNRIFGQPVTKYVDLSGATEPLDVVEYGGRQSALATIASGVQTALIAAPPTGFNWRIHSWSWRFSAAAGTTGDVFIWDGSSIIYADDIVTATKRGGPLEGQLAGGQVFVFNDVNAAIAAYVTYDLVIVPAIT